jgi:membrane protein
MSFLKLLFPALKLWIRKESDQYAAALSYFVPFALTPLLLISLAWVGLMLGTDRLLTILIEWGRVIDPALPAVMGEALMQLADRSQEFQLPIVGIAFFSIMILVAFNSLTAGIHKLWDVNSNGWRNMLSRYGRALLMIILIQAYFVFLIIMSGLVSWFDSILPVVPMILLQSVLFLASTIILLTFGYRVLPLQTVPFRSCLYGATIAGFMFYGLRSFVAFHIVTAPAVTFFGAASIIVVLLIWFYAVAAVILFGAAFAKVHADYNRLTI